MNAQNQKTIFITGSSSGLGRATAKLFASKWWKVIASMRNPEKETELNNISGVALMALDITNPKQITSVAEAVMARGGVDVVFNDELVDRVMSKITDPKQMETYSSPGQIAEVVYEAATDGKKQLRYVAGADATATYAMRLQMGDEAFRNVINQQFFGQ